MKSKKSQTPKSIANLTFLFLLITTTHNFWLENLKQDHFGTADPIIQLELKDLENSMPDFESQENLHNQLENMIQGVLEDSQVASEKKIIKKNNSRRQIKDFKNISKNEKKIERRKSKSFKNKNTSNKNKNQKSEIKRYRKQKIHDWDNREFSRKNKYTIQKRRRRKCKSRYQRKLRNNSHSLNKSFWLFMNSLFTFRRFKTFVKISKKINHNDSLNLATISKIFSRKNLSFQRKKIKKLISPAFNFSEYILWLFSNSRNQILFHKFMTHPKFGRVFLKRFAIKNRDLRLSKQIAVIINTGRVSSFWSLFWKIYFRNLRQKRKIRALIANFGRIERKKFLENTKPKSHLGSSKKLENSQQNKISEKKIFPSPKNSKNQRNTPKNKKTPTSNLKAENLFNKFKQKKQTPLKKNYLTSKDTRTQKQTPNFKLIRKERLKPQPQPKDLSNVKIGSTRFLDVFKDKINNLKRNIYSSRTRRPSFDKNHFENIYSQIHRHVNKTTEKINLKKNFANSRQIKEELEKAFDDWKNF